MSKFKVGDKVRVIKLSEVDLFDFKMGEELKISRISEKFIGNSYVYFFNCKTSGLYEEQLELAQQLDPKKTLTIQEVLVEDNVGKKFEFRGSVFDVINIALGVALRDCKHGYIEDLFDLNIILNGKFTLIEEPKQFTEEIDFKEAFERLCDGEEVKFKLKDEGFDIIKYENGKFSYKPNNSLEFIETNSIKFLSGVHYTKYYKK